MSLYFDFLKPMAVTVCTFLILTPVLTLTIQDALWLGTVVFLALPLLILLWFAFTVLVFPGYPIFYFLYWVIDRRLTTRWSIEEDWKQASCRLALYAAAGPFMPFAIAVFYVVIAGAFRFLLGDGFEALSISPIFIVYRDLGFGLIASSAIAAALFGYLIKRLRTQST